MESQEQSKGASKPRPVLSIVSWTHWLARKDETTFEKKKKTSSKKKVFLNNYSFIFRHNVIGFVFIVVLRCTFLIYFSKGTIF